VLRWRRPQTLIAATPSATRTHPIANPINPLAGTTERVSQRESRHWNHRKMMTAAIERSDCNDMVLSGSYRGMNGEETRVRGTWRRDGSEVQETTRISTDGGNTWRTWFDLVFRRAGTRAETNDARRSSPAWIRSTRRRTSTMTSQRWIASWRTILFLLRVPGTSLPKITYSKKRGPPEQSTSIRKIANK
jgi:hypothetical protein